MSGSEKPRRPRRVRDLSTAVWLRPADIAELTGLSGTTIHRMLTATGDARLPSVQYKGKSGRKGVRLVKRSEFDRFMARHVATEGAA